MKRTLHGLFFLAALIVFTYLANGKVGVSTQCVGAVCLVSAAASPLSIGGGLVIFIAALLLPRPSLAPAGGRVGIFRKLTALFIDIFLVLMGFSALFALPMLLVESNYVGEFHWQFVRSSLRPTDWPLALFAVGGMFAVVAAFRVLASMREQPTLGQYLLGYHVIAVAKPLAAMSVVKRTMLAGICLLLAPAYLLYKKIAGLQDDVWDVKAHTRSVRFTYR